MKIKYYQRFFKPADIASAPHHYFYGSTRLQDHGMEVSYYGDSSMGMRIDKRILRGIRTAYHFIFTKESYQLVYASISDGLEILVLLRALGLYHKPIVVWQHRALKHSNNALLNKALKFYYRGFDKLFLFTSLHIEQSMAAGVIDSHKLMLMKWGPDLQYYERLVQSGALSTGDASETYFCSTGRENRDFPTLIQAFNKLPETSLRLYTTRQHAERNNEETLLTEQLHNERVQVRFTDGTPSNNLLLTSEVYHSYASLICCYQHDYTVGLTSLFDAMALGKPIITSDNPYFPIDVEKENIGIKVPYGDIQGWVKAISFLSENEEIANQMGRNAKKLVEQEYNLTRLAVHIAEVLKDVVGSQTTSLVRKKIA